MVERLKQALTNAYRKDREDHRDVPADNVVVDLNENGLSMHLVKTAVELHYQLGKERAGFQRFAGTEAFGIVLIREVYCGQWHGIVPSAARLGVCGTGRYHYPGIIAADCCGTTGCVPS